MDNHADKDFVTVGKIGATYGVKGWLHIHSFTEYGAGILEYSPWYLSGNNQPLQEIVVQDGKAHGDGVIAKFTGFDAPETARSLTGLSILIKRSQMPALPENEYYWSDLEGLDVYDASHTLLGKVVYLISTGSNDALVIDHHGREYAIPYLMDSVIKKIDLEKREIHVDWELI